MNIIEIVIEKLIDTFEYIFKIELSEKVREGVLQFVMFGIVGLSNTIIGFLIYVISLYSMRRLSLFKGYDYYIAQFIMFVLSVLWSFYWNNKAVFKKNDGEKRNYVTALLKTYASYALTSLLLNELLLALWVEKIGLNEYFAPILNLLITVPLNFILQKFWAFKKRIN